MKISLNRNGKEAIFQQIYSQIENRILSGNLKAGKKLPSIRKLSEELGVSHMTVVRVYEKLTKMNLTEKIHGKGTFVKSHLMSYTASQIEQGYGIDGPGETKGKKDREDNISGDWQEEMQDYVSNSSFRFVKNLAPSYTGLNLSIAALGSEYLPLDNVFQGFEELVKEHNVDFGKYPPIEGDVYMREKIREYLLDRNIHAGIENILVASGSQIAINIIAMTFVGPGDVVVVEAPTYPGAIDIFKNRGARVIEVDVEDDGMDMFQLLSVCESNKVKMVYTMPNFQNPTGTVMSLEKKQMLLELADEHNFLVVEDDIWSILSYEGTVEPLKAIDKNGRVIYISGFSKVYGPAYKLSAIIASGSIYSRLASLKSNLDFGTAVITQKLLSAYLSSIEEKRFLVDLKYRLKKTRDNIYEALKKYMPSYVRVNKPKGGIVFWLTFPKGFNCQELFYKAVSEENISFLPGDFCYSERRGGNHIRICFTFVREELVLDAVKKLGKLIKELGDGSQVFG